MEAVYEVIDESVDLRYVAKTKDIATPSLDPIAPSVGKGLSIGTNRVRRHQVVVAARAAVGVLLLVLGVGLLFAPAPSALESVPARAATAAPAPIARAFAPAATITSPASEIAAPSATALSAVADPTPAPSPSVPIRSASRPVASASTPAPSARVSQNANLLEWKDPPSLSATPPRPVAPRKKLPPLGL